MKKNIHSSRLTAIGGLLVLLGVPVLIAGVDSVSNVSAPVVGGDWATDSNASIGSTFGGTLSNSGGSDQTFYFFADFSGGSQIATGPSVLITGADRTGGEGTVSYTGNSVTLAPGVSVVVSGTGTATLPAAPSAGTHSTTATITGSTSPLGGGPGSKSGSSSGTATASQGD